MNALTLIRRSLWFYRRTHLGALLGTALAAAVLTGALAVGDSLRSSLHAMALDRLGEVRIALAAPEGFFSDDAGDALAADVHCLCAPVLSLSGSADNEDRSLRANQVAVIGVDERFWELFPAPPLLKGDEEDDVVINEPLAARRLGIEAGDKIYLRLPKPSLLPIETAFSPGGQGGLRLGLTVKAVAGPRQFGNFSLRAGPAPLTVFVPLKWLQRRMDLPGKVNTLLAGGDVGGRGNHINDDANFCDRASEFLRNAPDRAGLLGLSTRALSDGGCEIRSERVFIPPQVESAAAKVPGAWGVLTYFVNRISGGDGNTPYSMVSALGPLLPAGSGATAAAPGMPDIPASTFTYLKEDEILLTDWLAKDLFQGGNQAPAAGLPFGDVSLHYFTLGPAGPLAEETSRFRISSQPPLAVDKLDPSLMPDFPGLAEANECTQWQPGIPIDTRLIRKKDEQYWREYRGTPKAFISLSAAERIWGNRFGRLTAIRFPKEAGAPAEVLEKVCDGVDPASMGLVFRPVREEALKAAAKSMDFGWLFASMSMFLIFSALLLTGMLFGLSIRQRAPEIGTLLATGMTPARVRRLFLCEGTVLAAVGAIIGGAAAVGYGQAVLATMRYFLPAATDAAGLRFEASAATLAEGAGMTLVMAAATMWLVLRRLSRATVRELLASGASTGAARPASGRAFRWTLAGAALMIAGTILMVLVGGSAASTKAALFYGAGAMLLCGVVLASYAMIARTNCGLRISDCGLERRKHSSWCRLLFLNPKSEIRNPKCGSLAALGRSNSARHVGRSVTVVALLACGTFVVVSVGAYWQSPSSAPYDRKSGTGGFALLARTAAAIQADPFAVREAGGTGPAPTPPAALTRAAPSGLPRAEPRGLPRAPSRGVSVVPIRVSEGDEASCLNLNRPQQPAVWGVEANELASRGAFAFADFAPGCDAKDGWLLLNGQQSSAEIPAIADATALEWALGASVGDIVTVTDEQGRPVKLRIVASLAGSILQGGLLISEWQFLHLYPSSGGYKMFLIDAPPRQAADAEKVLAANHRLQDAGLDLVRTPDRLAQLDAVENAYIAMFQVLGGLGVLLGTVGMGLVVFRNVMERRGELGLMRAVGFSGGRLRRLILWEHWGLLAMGLIGGAAAGLLAVLPGLIGPSGAAGMGAAAGSQVPWTMLATMVAGIGVVGIFSTRAAAAVALRGPLIAALRNE